MTFLEAVKICFTQKFATFNGRARRSEYWYFALFNFVASTAANAIASATEISLLASIVSIAFFIPSLAVCVRRLHDVNKSGWWYLIVFTIVGIFYLLYLMVKEGDHGTNQYGPDPKGDINDDNNVVEDRKNEIEKMGGDSVI